ncbi:MAG: hypothetical protein ABIK33_04605, partial [candidate division WOR-3 bacterium]
MPSIKICRNIFWLLICLLMMANGEINWNGYFQLDERLLINDWSLSWQVYRLSLQTDYKPNEHIRFFSEI